MSDQVGQFINKAETVVNGPDAPPIDHNTPMMPFPTNLMLTRDQEVKMIDHAFDRMKTIENETGRDQTINPTWWLNTAPAANMALASQGLQAADTFMGKRSRYDATFYNDVSWRPWTMGPDNIFMSSNLVVPLSRRICRQMIARAKNSFFGAEPWFSVEGAPVPEHDEQPDAERAQRIERYCRFKARESNSMDDKERAIRNALILGECAVKTNYLVRDQLFNVDQVVLMDMDGHAVRAADGNHITPEDQFVDAEDGSGSKVLARDGQTPEPMAPIWQKVPLNRRQVLFEGARSEPIYFKDFICPMTATDIQTADLIAHFYDKPVMVFIDLLVKRGMIGDTPDERMKGAQKLLALVKALSENSSQPKAAVSSELRPNENFAVAPSSNEGQPISEFAEVYMWFDANGDGVAENIMLIVDRKNRVPVFYDHVANVTTDGLRPIEIVRVNPVEGRWYGLGIMELFESYQTVTDLMVNRWNFSQSRSGRVDLWTPQNTLEGDRDPNLKMNWGGSYTKKPGLKKEDVLESVYLTDVKFEQIQTMIQFFMQLAMNESGVSNANDDQAAGMQSAKLATGIMEVAKSGDELFNPLLKDLTGPLTRLLDREIAVGLANMNPKEVYTYLEGDTMGIETMTPEDVRGLRFKTKITLSTQRTQERLQMSAAAAAIVERFYLLDPNVQQYVATFYRQQLRQIDASVDADAAIVAMPIQPAMPGGETVPFTGGKPAGGGSQAKLGDQGPNTDFAAQLTQQVNKH